MGPPSDVSVEPAQSDDLPAILDLLERSGLPLDGFAGHLSTALVVRQGNRVVASAALELYGPAALLRSVAVDEPWRGRGIGKRVTLTALELSRQREVGTVYLLTETASAFFSHIGFKPLPRHEVPSSVQASVEFTVACPEAAQAMVLLMPGRPAL